MTEQSRNNESKDAQKKGSFQRQGAKFRHKISRDPQADFPAEANRYHIYASHACPWAHRTMIFRKLKKLESVISLSFVEPHMPAGGWQFSETFPDPVEKAKKLSEIYRLADPDYDGRFTVPVLWDKKKKTIVSNESAEIIRMLNSEFGAFTEVKYDFYPEDLQGEIDAINERIYETVNNGVYKAGFAETQEAYSEAYEALFETLDFLEKKLGLSHFLVGDRLTEADIRLFTTLVRFDAVYHNHFKCNRQKISEYAHLSDYLARIYRMEGVAETVFIDHIKTHYYTSHKTINPLGIIPQGPKLLFLD